MRRFAFLISISFCALSAVTCATYKQDLERARKHYENPQVEQARTSYEENNYEKALALLRVLEYDIDSFSQGEQAQYAYLRGMTDYRLSQSPRLAQQGQGEARLQAGTAGASDPRQGYRSNARHWLGVAQAIEKVTPGGLVPDEKQRMADALTDLNKDVYGGAEALPGGADADAGAPDGGGDDGGDGGGLTAAPPPAPNL